MNSPRNISRGCPRRGDQSFWDRQLRAQLGRDLRSIFENSLKEPLPEHLSSPLLQIEMVAREDDASRATQNAA